MELSLAELLVRAGVVTGEERDRAEAIKGRTGGSLVAALVRDGAVDEDRLMAFVGERFGLEAMDLKPSDVDGNAFDQLPVALLAKRGVLPVLGAGSVLSVAVSDPTTPALDEIRFITGRDVTAVLARPSAIEHVLDHRWRPRDQGAGSGEEAREASPEPARMRSGVPAPADAAGDAPVVAVVDSLMRDAVARGASDIHVEPYEDSVRVRFRIDGILQEVMTPPHEMKQALTSRIKVMAGLDIAEHRLPQDGRLRLSAGGGEVDVRVSVLPTRFGEKVVLRLLHGSDLVTSLDGLGLEGPDRERFDEAMGKPAGMILLTGPTGSGKSTTLYGMLSELNRPGVNISTAEDPVEYHLAGINQVQTHGEIGLSFAACLRAFLRQDPDILMVGEIRDAETARIAVNAALTGHLVLTTLHTNDAPSSVHRLLDMGVEPYLIASAITMVAAQRLLRRVCGGCKARTALQPGTLTAPRRGAQEVGDIEGYHGAGCPECHHTGYRGRVAVYEVMTLSDDLRGMILRGGSVAELKAAAMERGMRTLRQAAVRKVRQGVTSIEEALRVTEPDPAGERGILPGRLRAG